MVRFVEDAGFLLSNLGSDSTGVVGAVVWVACGEFSVDDGHLGPRILVTPGAGLSIESLDHAVPVTLSSPVAVLGTLPDAVKRTALSFARANQDVLLEHWRGESDTWSAIERLERVRSG